MYDDEFNPEIMKSRPETSGEDELNAEAERWAAAMEDAPDYIGPFGVEENDGTEEEQDDTKERKGEDEQEDGEMASENRPEYSEIEPDAEGAKTGDLAGANQLTSFGLDTASHIYGLGAVIQAVVSVDESGVNAENPLGAIYERLAPNPESRVQLYREIRKERVQGNQHNADAALDDADDPKIGLTADGEFYDKTQRDENGHQESVDAIRALRRLIDLLETSERLADVRERAAEQGKTIVEYLVCDESNPTLTDFFNRVGEEMSEEEVEEIVEELEGQVNPDVAEEREAEADTEASDFGNELMI